MLPNWPNLKGLNFSPKGYKFKDEGYMDFLKYIWE